MASDTPRRDPDGAPRAHEHADPAHHDDEALIRAALGHTRRNRRLALAGVGVAVGAALVWVARSGGEPSAPPPAAPPVAAAPRPPPPAPVPAPEPAPEPAPVAEAPPAPPPVAAPAPAPAPPPKPAPAPAPERPAAPEKYEVVDFPPANQTPAELTPEQEAQFDKLKAAGLAAARAERWKAALDALSKAVALRRDPVVLRDLGRAYYGRNAYPSALKALREAVLLDDKDPESFHLLGIIQQEMGNRAAACKAFRRVRELEAGSDRARELVPVMGNLGC